MDAARAAGHAYVVLPWVDGDARPADLDGYRRLAEELGVVIIVPLFERRGAVVHMRVVEIDGLHPQAAQTFLTLRFDLGGAQSALNARVLEADLRRDEKIPAIAALAHPLAE